MPEPETASVRGERRAGGLLARNAVERLEGRLDARRLVARARVGAGADLDRAEHDRISEYRQHAVGGPVGEPVDARPFEARDRAAETRAVGRVGRERLLEPLGGDAV